MNVVSTSSSVCLWSFEFWGKATGVANASSMQMHALVRVSNSWRWVLAHMGNWVFIMKKKAFADSPHSPSKALGWPGVWFYHFNTQDLLDWPGSFSKSSGEKVSHTSWHRCIHKNCPHLLCSSSHVFRNSRINCAWVDEQGSFLHFSVKKCSQLKVWLHFLR